MRFEGNLTIWREILTFDITKYIRNGGKCNYIPGKNAFFQALMAPLNPRKGVGEEVKMAPLLAEIDTFNHLVNVANVLRPLFCAPFKVAPGGCDPSALLCFATGTGCFLQQFMELVTH